MALAPGQAKEQALRQAGFGDQDIASWKQRSKSALQAGGYSSLDVDNYFGTRTPDTSWLQKAGDVGQNIRSSLVDAYRHNIAPTADDYFNKVKTVISNTAEAFNEPFVDNPVWQTTPQESAGLQKIPAFAGMRTYAGIGIATGKSIENLMSSAMTTPAGLAKGLALAAGANNGEAERLGRDVYAGVNVLGFAGAAGGAGAGVRSAGADGARAQAIQPVRVPEPGDFGNAATLIGGKSGAPRLTTKLQTVYAKTGITPDQVWHDASSNPAIARDLAASNIQIPKAYEKPLVPGADTVTPVPRPDEGIPAEQVPIPVAPEGKAAEPVKIMAPPPDLIKFVARRGGLSSEQAAAGAGDLQAMDAHRTFVPGAGMLVRKNGGMSLDYAREAANDAGYGPYETVNDFINGISNSLRGGDEFSNADYDRVAKWKEQQGFLRLPDEDAAGDRYSQINQLRDQAIKMGIKYDDTWSSDDLTAEIIYREAMRDGGDENLNAVEALQDRYISTQYPHLMKKAVDNGYESDIPFGSEYEAAGSPEQNGGRYDSISAGSQGVVGSGEGARGRSEFTSENGQLAIPGSERSARQLAAARENASHGRSTSGVTQKDANEGLFAPTKSNEPVMFQRQFNPQVDTREFKNWFGRSKVVDRNGDPKVMYHATDADITKFEKNKFGSSTRDVGGRDYAIKASKLGVWFNDKPLSETMGRSVDYPVYLSIEKPYAISLENLFTEMDSGSPQKFRKTLENDGYDGLLISDSEFGGWSYVAFEPTQIKSAIGNVGTFDSYNPNITMQRGTDWSGVPKTNTGETLSSKEFGKLSPEESKIRDQVETIISRMAPRAKSAGARALRVGEEPVYGSSYNDGARRFIAWSLESPDVVGTARHEIIHYLKASGLFNKEEWSTLEKAAVSEKWSDAYDIDKRYSDLPPDIQLQEAIAEKFSDWRRGVNQPTGALALIWRKVQQFMQRVSATVRRMVGSDVTPEDVFSRIESGEVGGRRPPLTIENENPYSQRTPAEQSVLSRIVAHPESEKKAVSFDDFYTRFVDESNPIKTAEEAIKTGKITPENSAYVMARLFRGKDGILKEYLERRAVDFATGNPVGKSFDEIMRPIKKSKDYDGLRAYLAARRSVELSERGIESGIPIDAARDVIASGDAKYAETAQDLQDYQRNILNYLRDSGVLGKEQYSKIVEANQQYVPFYRLMDEPKPVQSVARGSVRNPVKKIEGSERQILDPLESIVRNTQLYIGMAEKNRVFTSLAKLSDEAGESNGFIERVKEPVKPITITEPEVTQLLKQYGIDAGAQEFTVFRKNMFRPSRDEISVFSDGKRTTYKVTPELADACELLDPPVVPFYVKMLKWTAVSLRAGATLMPDFIARNLIRDQMTATSLSKYKFIPIWDTMRGLREVFKKGEDYDRWLTHGGSVSSMVSIDRDYFQKRISKIESETSLLNAAWNVAKTPIEVLRAGGEIFENATRLGAFKAALRGTSNYRLAAYNARESTIDFSRIGSQMHSFNSITAFSNVGIQGLDRTIRAFKENPAKMLATAIATITLPSVLLYMANKDDPRWNAIPDWQKDLYWLFMTKDHIYRIPKPFELGIMFGSLPERILEATMTDKGMDAFGGWSDTFVSGFTPNYIPTVIQPFFEQWANKSTFTGNALIPSSMESILPEFQYTDYTTEAAKKLGHILSAVPWLQAPGSIASPAVIENYVQNWSGGLGMYVLQAADGALRSAGVMESQNKPTPTLADIPFVKAFVVRYPSASAQNIEDFYSDYQKSQSVLNTIKSLASRGDQEAAMKIAITEENSGDLVKADGAYTALRNMSKTVHMIYINPDMTPDDKRQMIDQIYAQMITVADYGNSAVKDMRNIMKQSIPTQSSYQEPQDMAGSQQE